MHKFIIALALAAAGTANAAVIGTMPNKAGGTINLTNTKSEYCGKSRRVVFFMHPQGDVLMGCWTIVEEKIHIRYEQGTTRMHEFLDFDWKPERINEKEDRL